MNYELDANYFAGIKPKAQKASVVLMPGQLQIRTFDGIQEKSSFWDIKKIIPDQDEHDGSLILSYRNNGIHEFIEFTETDALGYLKKYYPDKKWIRSKNMLISNPMISLFLGMGLFILMAIGAYFLFVPNIADLAAKSVPVKWEIELGDKLGSGLISEEKKDGRRSMMLDSFYLMMDIQSEYPIRFHFIDDSIMNAFAVPGGHIVIYKGLFDKMTTYESLAGLIGHEFTHIEFKHSLKSIFRTMSSFILLAAVFGDLTGIAGIILENANTIQNLSYSRKFEHEADEHAVKIMLERKIGLTGLLDLFKVFQDESKEGTDIPKFLNTHPVTEDRIQFIKTQMASHEGEIVHYENLFNLFNRMKGL